MKKKITWLLFHEPAELFIRTAEEFASILNKLTDNSYEFEILELEEYEKRYYDGQACDPLQELRSGRVQMSQLYIETLANANVTNFNSLSLPYLFRDHDHATRVFEGEIGTELLDHVHETIGIKGLSFTYSGGYKCMAVNQPIKDIEDFSGLTFRSITNSLTVDVFRALGAKPTEDIADFKDTTLPRYGADCLPSQSVAVKTDHAMYLTTILANSTLIDELSDEHLAAFYQAAKQSAHAERIKSVQDAEEIAQNVSLQRSLNIQQLITLTAAQHAQLKQLLTPVLNKWKPYFPNALVERIQTA